jgi:hypothetical protein
LPPPPDRGPKLFFTSAKTGEGVSAVFEYIAGRVIRRWEYEERLEARQLHIREASAVEPIRLGFGQSTRGRERICGLVGHAVVDSILSFRRCDTFLFVFMFELFILHETLSSTSPFLWRKNVTVVYNPSK